MFRGAFALQGKQLDDQAGWLERKGQEKSYQGDTDQPDKEHPTANAGDRAMIEGHTRPPITVSPTHGFFLSQDDSLHS